MHLGLFQESDCEAHPRTDEGDGRWHVNESIQRYPAAIVDDAVLAGSWQVKQLKWRMSDGCPTPWRSSVGKKRVVDRLTETIDGYALSADIRQGQKRHITFATTHDSSFFSSQFDRTMYARRMKVVTIALPQTMRLNFDTEWMCYVTWISKSGSA